MPKTPSIPLGTQVSTEGVLGRNPMGGSSRATRGYAMRAVELDTTALDFVAPLSTEAIDSSGRPRLINNSVQSIRYIEVYRSLFAHPDREYTGYAANGYWYDLGILNPLHDPEVAWWIHEAGEPSIDRGFRVPFPSRILVVSTLSEVAIFDADNLDMWMRFRLPESAPPGNGNFLGGPTTKIRAADFFNGYLVVATDEGLKIANFRNDEAYLYGDTNSFLSAYPLDSRNGDTYMDGTDISAPTRLISSLDCLEVSSNAVSNPATSTKESYTLLALGHSLGFDGIILTKSGLTYPEVKQSPISKGFATAWSVADDGDGSPTSPYFIDGLTNWLGAGVEAGDVLVTDTPSEHVIVLVDQTVPGNRLVVDPELPVGATGASYSISRSSPVVRVDLDGSLYFANGQNRVTKVATTDWYEGGSPVFTDLLTGFPSSDLAAVVETINELALVQGAGVFYVATSLGVFYGEDQNLEDNAKLEFRYSSEEVVDVVATYKILIGAGSSVGAIGVDPETGNLLVSLDEKTGDVVLKSVLSEINTTIQQTFRYFDRVGILKEIATYRNATGPPDEEVT